MVINSAYTGPHLATSSVAPAPCSARARPCLDVWRGEPLLVQRRSPACFAGPRASGTHGRCRAQESTVWCFQPPLASGLVWLGTGPRRGPSRPGYPGSPGGRPASLTFSTCCSILSMYTRPTATVCSSATHPLPLPTCLCTVSACLFSSSRRSPLSSYGQAACEDRPCRTSTCHQALAS